MCIKYAFFDKIIAVYVNFSGRNICMQLIYVVSLRYKKRVKQYIKSQLWHRQENITSVVQAAVGEFGTLTARRSWDAARIFTQWSACTN